LSTLTAEGIRKRIREPDEHGQLVITPLLDSKQIDDASVDLRLGFEFIVFNLPSIESIDPSQEEEIKREIHRYQRRVRINRAQTDRF
jgi:deoxycytidine triphosphate deaminase